jgi:hypothetical protein
MSIRKIHVLIFMVGPMLKLLGIRAQMRSEVWVRVPDLSMWPW